MKKEHESKQLPKDVVVSDSFKTRSVVRKLLGKKYLLGLIVMLLVIASVTGYLLLFMNKEDKIAAPRTVDISGVRGYTEMTKAQIDYSLYRKTGLTIEYLQNKGVHAKQLSDFNIAYEAAQALFAYGDKQRALQAYAIAQDKKTQDTDYTFYFTYAAAALRSGDKTTWKKEMLLAREVVSKQPQPKDPSGAMTADQVDSIIKATESEE